MNFLTGNVDQKLTRIQNPHILSGYFGWDAPLNADNQQAGPTGQPPPGTGGPGPKKKIDTTKGQTTNTAKYAAKDGAITESSPTFAKTADNPTGSPFQQTNSTIGGIQSQSFTLAPEAVKFLSNLKPIILPSSVTQPLGSTAPPPFQQIWHPDGTVSGFTGEPKEIGYDVRFGLQDTAAINKAAYASMSPDQLKAAGIDPATASAGGYSAPAPTTNPTDSTSGTGGTSGTTSNVGAAARDDA